jgi:hypothetical protein
VDFGTQYDPNYDNLVDAPEEGSDEEVEEDEQQSQSQSQSSQHY